MDFLQKYSITARYLTTGSKRRSGLRIAPAVKFVVAHDTGNPGSTAAANARYYENSRNEMSASAHIFVDNNEIIECIPALTGPPEKAWHVLYDVPTDNRLYGVNANDAAIGVEYCYGKPIDADEAYRKYVWLMAFICSKFGLDPKISVVGHFFLDPQRRTDPVTGLADSRRTYDQLLRDIAAEFCECSGIPRPQPVVTSEVGTVRATCRLNIRQKEPSTRAPALEVVLPGTSLNYVGWVDTGESVNGNAKWYKDRNGNFFWAGGVV